MTVCKTFKRIILEKGKLYRRSDVICDLEGQENMVASYFDPPRDMVYTFFVGNNSEWVDNYEKQTGEFTVKHSINKELKKTPPWECTKIRHVFFQREGMAEGYYEYLGTSIDENRLSDNGFDVRQFFIS